jgi:hypothetical protein
MLWCWTDIRLPASSWPQQLDLVVELLQRKGLDLISLLTDLLVTLLPPPRREGHQRWLGDPSVAQTLQRHL